jgi:sarcosine oxidase gamma subunit
LLQSNAETLAASIAKIPAQTGGFMKLAATGALALLFVQAPLPGTQQSQPPKASIEGSVLRADNGEPIAKVQLTLSRMVPPPQPGQTPATPVTPPPQIPPVMTDAAGKFSFVDLEPGSYRLVATKNGFVRHDYGARTTGGTGAPFDLPAGRSMKDVSFKLVQTAVISGRVRTSSGEVGAGLNIQLMRSVYNQTGQRTLQAMSSGRTDDRGEYRLFWIAPGRYYVSVAGGRSSTIISSLDGAIFLTTSGAEASTANPLTVYYPGTTDPLRATAVEVGAGGELAAIDLVLPEQQAHRIRGRLVDSSTGMPPRTASISLVPRDPSFSGLTANVPPNYNATTGTFDLRDVAPGQYWIRAQATESTATALITPNAVGRTLSEALSLTAAPRTSAQRSLDVAGDIEGVVLELGPGISIPGILRVEGPALPATPLPRVSLRPTAPNGLAPPLLPVNADGTFTLTNVAPGEYRIFVTAMPQDYYVKEARIEQIDILNDPLVITGPLRGNLSVVLSSGAAQIDGTVIDARLQPVAALQTVLIPDRNRDRTDLVRYGMTDHTGKFTLRGVPPGNYKIYAWESIEPNAFFDPQVLQQFETQGKAIRVEEGGKITTEVKMIPAKP